MYKVYNSLSFHYFIIFYSLKGRLSLSLIVISITKNTYKPISKLTYVVRHARGNSNELAYT